MHDGRSDRPRTDNPTRTAYVPNCPCIDHAGLKANGQDLPAAVAQLPQARREARQLERPAPAAVAGGRLLLPGGPPAGEGWGSAEAAGRRRRRMCELVNRSRAEKK